MRTTLDIDDDVLAAAKDLSRQQGLSAGAVSVWGQVLLFAVTLGSVGSQVLPFANLASRIIGHRVQAWPRVRGQGLRFALGSNQRASLSWPHWVFSVSVSRPTYGMDRIAESCGYPTFIEARSA